MYRPDLGCGHYNDGPSKEELHKLEVVLPIKSLQPQDNELVTTKLLIAELLIKRLGPHAQLPVGATTDCTGYDLALAELKIIGVHTRQLVDTQFSMALLTGTYGCIAPRSGLAVKHSIDIGAGVIDPGYRSPVKVLVINNSDKPFTVQIGD